eukprot:gene34696-42796_t
MPIFEKGWSINEELTLLDAIEKYGVGNWKTIAENVLSNKTTKQVEDHYWETYMGSHGYCLPTKTILNDGTAVETASFFPSTTTTSSTSAAAGGLTGSGNSSSSSAIPSEASENTSTTTHPNELTAEESHLSPVETGDAPIVPSTSGKGDEDLNRIRVVDGYTLGETVRRDIDKVSTTYNSKKNDSSSAKQGNQAIRPESLPGHDLLGFIPLREDFDYEFENDAELMLADMDFDLNDHPSERELKLQVIAIYNRKLEERDRRKRFVIDRGLVDFKNQQNV